MDFPLTAPMILHPDAMDIATRLIATLLAGAVIGFNRERGGHPAGFRTTILVGLAACLSMIEGNLLLTTPVGDAHSAVRLDVLRLALGTLTGVGFIGAGAIMHKGDLVTGVTTAATLWVITAIGICFGGGQIALGAIATAVAFLVLSPMKHISDAVRRQEKAFVVIRQKAERSLPAVGDALEGLDCHVRFLSRKRAEDDLRAVLLTYQVSWHDRKNSTRPADLIAALERRFDLVSVSMANAEL